MVRVAKQKVLFICRDNSYKSQMAEAWGKSLFGEQFEFNSAGSKPEGLDLLAIRVMREAGVDISNQASKSLSDLGDAKFDQVIIIDGDGKERAARYSLTGEVKEIKLAKSPLETAESSGDELVESYCATRDEIRDRVKELVRDLSKKRPGTS